MHKLEKKTTQLTLTFFFISQGPLIPSTFLAQNSLPLSVHPLGVALVFISVISYSAHFPQLLPYLLPISLLGEWGYQVKSTGEVVKGTKCSSKGRIFDFQHPQSVSAICNSRSGYQMSYSGFLDTAHMWLTYLQASDS